MVDRKYNNILTGVLVVVVLAIIGVLGFYGYQTFKEYGTEKDTKAGVDEFDSNVNKLNNNTQRPVETQDQGTTPSNNGSFDFEKIKTEQPTTNQGNKKVKISTTTFKGFTVAGKIEIPKIGVSYPVLARASASAMELSVCLAYGPGLNEVGNNVIMGHNYRNRLFFSKLHQVANGDSVFVTDTSGNKVEYIVYNVYTTGPDDFDYANRDTAGKREISLQTCTDDVQKRLIVWAREKE